MSESDREWYVRRGSAVQGPYDLEQLRRYLLLGRIRLTDRVSEDGESWSRLTQLPELIPEEMRDLGSEEGLARFEAAHRAADERGRDEDRPLRAGGARRDDPGPADAAAETSRRQTWLLPALLVAVAILLTAMWVIQV